MAAWVVLEAERLSHCGWEGCRKHAVGRYLEVARVLAVEVFVYLEVRIC